jgi:hypothetical protein
MITNKGVKVFLDTLENHRKALLSSLEKLLMHLAGGNIPLTNQSNKKCVSQILENILFYIKIYLFNFLYS